MKTHPIIHLSFWSDTNKKACSPPEQVLLIYLANNTHTNRLGCFRLPLRYMAQDLNWTDVFLKRTFNQLINADFLLWDNSNEWGYLTCFLDWFPIKSYYQTKDLERSFNVIPSDCYLRQVLVGHLLQIPYLDRSFRCRLNSDWKSYSSFEAPSKFVVSEEINHLTRRKTNA
jgi:hypothetical protein